MVMRMVQKWWRKSTTALQKHPLQPPASPVSAWPVGCMAMPHDERGRGDHRDVSIGKGWG